MSIILASRQHRLDSNEIAGRSLCDRQRGTESTVGRCCEIVCFPHCHCLMLRVDPLLVPLQRPWTHCRSHYTAKSWTHWLLVPIQGPHQDPPLVHHLPQNDRPTHPEDPWLVPHQAKYQHPLQDLPLVLLQAALMVPPPWTHTQPSQGPTRARQKLTVLLPLSFDFKVL
jgi:hypothetical protein